MAAPLDTAAEWPQAHISGPTTACWTSRRAWTLVLDGVPDGGGPFCGAIYLDELRSGDAALPPRAFRRVQPLPRKRAGRQRPPKCGSQRQPARLGGRIVYPNAAGGVSVLDVASRNTWDLRPRAAAPARRPMGALS